MHTRTRFALLIALALGAAACRQPDGPIPTPSREQRNEIGDIARDMQNLVNRDAEAPADLANDINKYGQTEEAVAQSQELARRLVAALPGARLDDATADRVAHTLWLALTATELSTRQVDALEAELTQLLTSAGVPQERAESVAQQLGEVQREVTNNPKRWYQLF